MVVRGLFVCQFQNDFDSRENPTDASVDNDPIRMLRVPGMVAQNRCLSVRESFQYWQNI